MRKRTLLVMSLLLPFLGFTQTEETQTIEEQLYETVSEELSSENEGDLIEKDFLRRHPLDLNKTGEDELKLLDCLSPTQIQNFIQYRAVMGKLIHAYELQAIPGWDPVTIRKLLPYILVSDTATIYSRVRNEWKNGEHLILIRAGRKYLTQEIDEKFLGSATALLFKYNYRYKNELRIGLTCDKDAGEPFFKKQNRAGFDFYSAHVFLQPKNKAYAIALGDFTIQLGQGLVQWQGLAFGKSAETMMINRQGPILRPYTSSGEFNFHRGIAALLGRKRWTFLVFVSKQRLSANAITDSVSRTRYFSSIQTGGYHRSVGEMADKNQLSLLSSGLASQYQFPRGRIGMQVVGYQFGDSLKKEVNPYNYYTFKGKNLINSSIDFRYTFRNLHLFGEAAFDHTLGRAIVGGAVLGLGGGLDVSLLYRNYDKDYHSLFTNGFSEYSGVANEKGLYVGINFKPAGSWRLSAYSDIFGSDWVRQTSRQPSSGWKFLVQINYDPSKTTGLYLRFRNQQLLETNYSPTENDRASSFRIHFQQRINRTWESRTRLETNWVWEQKRTVSRGSLVFTDLLYEPMMSSFAGSLRVLYFDTNGYATRLYAFEPDVLYSYNTPAFFG